MDEKEHKALIAVVLVAVIGFGFYSYTHGLFLPTSPKGTGATLSVYEDFPGGVQKLISGPPVLALISGGGGGGSGGTGVSFQPTNTISFSGDTITGGSCSGTVSFSSVGGITPASQAVSVSLASSYSSGASALTSQATVPFSDFTALPSGTYTLTATYTSSCSVTFTNGGPDSGVAIAASTSPTVSTTITSSGGVVTGVTATV